MAKFNLIVDSRECGILIYALGTLYERVPESFTLAARIAALSLWSDASAARSPQPVGMPAAVETAAPAPEPKPSTPAPPPKKQTLPDGELTLTLISAEMAADGKSLVTTCKTRTANGVKTSRLRCWEPTQWERIKASVGKSTIFLTKSTEAGFTNIVGVKS